MGSVSSAVRETGLLPVSLSVNSGACWFTCGAFVEGGSHRDTTNAVKINIAMTSTLSVATIGATIFETSRRPGANARRTPKNKRTNARMNSGIFTQGKSRVVAQFAKMNG